MKDFLWTWKTVEELLCVKPSSHGWHATGVSIKSQDVTPGDIFVALQGSRAHGADFLDDAFHRGAVAAIIPEGTPQEKIPPGLFVLPVMDTFKALETLALHGRSRFSGKSIALTGSTGKTSVKEGLYHVLSSYDTEKKVYRSFKNFNNQLGLFFNLANLPPDTDVAIFELGMNHTGEIEKLVEILRPHYAMVINVSLAHSAHFSSIEDIVAAKGEIFSQGAEAGILWKDSPHYDLLRAIGEKAGVCSWVTYGETKEATLSIAHVDMSQKDHWTVHMTLTEEEETHFSYAIPVVGQHWVHNSAAILAAVHALGKDPLKASHALKDFYPLRGRGMPLVFSTVTVLDGTYNAAPAAMISALDHLRYYPHTGRKWAILGSMRELKDPVQTHLDLLPSLLASQAEGFVLCGEDMRSLYEHLPPALQWGFAHDLEETRQHLTAVVQPGDIILMKASNGWGFWQLLECFQNLSKNE